MGAVTRWFWDGSEASPLARVLRVATFVCAVFATVFLLLSWNRPEWFTLFMWLFVLIEALDLARRLVQRQSGMAVIGQAVALLILAALAVAFTVS